MLFAAAASVGMFDARTQAIMTATVIISMALTPLLVMSLKWIVPTEEESLDGVDPVDKLNGRVLVVGFGRFGQIASQSLLLRGVDVSIIDNDIEMIKAAATFGFKVYYGDGTRLDILHAAGAGRAEAVLVCVDKGDAAVTIARHVKAEFPLVPVFARAYDRRYSMQLVRAGVDYQIRETFEFGDQVRRGRAGQAGRHARGGGRDDRGCAPARPRAPRLCRSPAISSPATPCSRATCRCRRRCSSRARPAAP